MIETFLTIVKEEITAISIIEAVHETHTFLISWLMTIILLYMVYGGLCTQRQGTLS